jgi:hypothetical protein
MPDRLVLPGIKLRRIRLFLSPGILDNAFLKEIPYLPVEAGIA